MFTADIRAVLRRAFLASSGHDDESIDKPIVGIAHTMSDYTTCHREMPQLVDAVKRGVRAWEAAAGVEFEIVLTDRENASGPGAAGDGVSLITIAPSAENMLIFGRDDLDAAAKTRIFYNRKGSITEADIVLNPTQQFSTDGGYGAFDLEATVTHEVGHLLRGYWQLGSNPRFFMLALASGIPFNGMFLYVLSAPVFLGELLHLGPGQFFWFFTLTITGIMGGAFLSGRLAGRIKPKHQIRHGFVIMLLVSLTNVTLNLLFQPQAWWALWPIAIFAFGWALMVPVITLMVLDLAPDRRGMASSLQACVGSVANGIVAGVVAPLVMHSTVALAIASLLMMSIGVVAWVWVKPRVTT